MNTEIEKALSFAIEEGKIDLEQIRLEYAMMKKAEYLSLHPNGIYQGKDGLYYTYIGKGRKERRKVKRKTKEELEDYLVEYYKSQEENMTFSQAFRKWIYWK